MVQGEVLLKIWDILLDVPNASGMLSGHSHPASLPPLAHPPGCDKLVCLYVSCRINIEPLLMEEQINNSEELSWCWQSLKSFEQSYKRYMVVPCKQKLVLL